MKLYLVAACVALSGCSGCDVYGTFVTHLEGSPDAVRAAGFVSPDELVAIGGDSAFGLHRLHEARTESNHEGGLQTRTWTPVDEVPPFDANATIVGTFALSETQLYARESGVWTAHPIPLGATPNTAFAASTTTVYAIELMSDGAGAVLAWRLGESRWQEVDGTRPIGVDARGFRFTTDGAIVWSSTSFGVMSVKDGTRTTLVDCAEERFGACAAPIDLLGAAIDSVLIATCPSASYVVESGVATEFSLPAGTARCQVPTVGGYAYHPIATFAPEDDIGGVYEFLGGDIGWSLIDEADPRLHYTTNVDGAYLGFARNPSSDDDPRGIDCILFL